MGTWVLDLDGVVWRGSELIEGSDTAVAALLARGDQVVCCTNNATSPEKKVEALDRLGVPRCPVITSGEAAVATLGDARRVLVLGDPSLVELMRAAGVDAIDVFELPEGRGADGVDAVVVGLSSRWDRARIGMVADSIRQGARFIATNDDATFPTTGPAGAVLLPGNGALVAAVSVAAGTAPEIAGKPHAAMAELIVTRHGPVDVVVGDKPDTDGRLATRLGARFGLVLSGVTSLEDLPVEPDPWLVSDCLAQLVERSGSGAPAR